MSTAEGRDVIVTTLRGLRDPQPRKLSAVLAESIPAADARMTSHIAGLISLGGLADQTAVLSP